MALEGWQGLDRLAGLLFGEADLVNALQVKPEFRSRAEEMGKAQGCVARDGSTSIHDFGDAVGWNIQLPRQFRGAHAQLFQFLRQMFTRVNRNYYHGVSPSQWLTIHTCNRGGAAIPRIRIGGGQVRSFSLAQEDKKGSEAGRIGLQRRRFRFQNGITNLGREEKSRQKISWKRLNWCITASDRNTAPGNPSPAPGRLPHGRLTKIIRSIDEEK